jgi:hypothetical protein
LGDDLACGLFGGESRVIDHDGTHWDHEGCCGSLGVAVVTFGQILIDSFSETTTLAFGEGGVEVEFKVSLGKNHGSNISALHH